jgi:hypothetical protein
MAHTKICEDIEQERGEERETVAGLRDLSRKVLITLNHKDV